MNLEKQASHSYRLLLRILEQAYSMRQDGDVRHAFIYRHAQTLLRLSEDVLHLEAEQRRYSSGIVTRVMLESLFNLVAAVKQPSFAVEKLIWEIEEEEKRIRKWIPSGSVGLGKAIRELEMFKISLRDKHQITSVANLNAFECARRADLGDQYRLDYFVLSKQVHATTSGMLSGENGLNSGHVLRTVVFVLLCASAHVVQVLPTKQPQRHLDRAAKLLERLTSLFQKDASRKLNASRDNTAGLS